MGEGSKSDLDSKGKEERWSSKKKKKKRLSLEKNSYGKTRVFPNLELFQETQITTHTYRF